MPKRAFAYVEPGGEIIIETVSPTERAAKVNTIVIATYRNVLPCDQDTDAEIDLMFLNATGGAGSIEPVEVSQVF